MTWLGGIDLADVGLWRGPATGVLVAAYAAIAYRSSRVRAAGDVFARFAVPFVHGAAALALGLTLYDTASFAHRPAWIFTGLLAIVGAGYLLYRLIGGSREGSLLGMGLLLLAWASLLSDAGAGSWRGPLTVLPGALAGVDRLSPSELRRPRREAGPGRCAVPPCGRHPRRRPVGRRPRAGRCLAALAGGGPVRRGRVRLPPGRPGRRGRSRGGVALAAAGLGWAAAAYDLPLGDWTGVAVAGLACLYPLAAIRPVRATRVGGLAVRQARFHLWGIAAIALAFVISLDALDLVTGWPAAATLAVLALGFALLAVLADDLHAALTARAAFGLAWAVTAKSYWGGQWAGPATAVLALVYAAPAHRSLGSTRIGLLASRHSEPFLYVTALVALGLSAGYAKSTTELVGWPTAITFGAAGGRLQCLRRLRRRAGCRDHRPRRVRRRLDPHRP